MFHLRNHTAAFDEFGEIFSSANTAAVTALVPATFYFYGLVRKNSYSEQTALLTGEAVLDSEIPAVAIKLITRRLRPNAVSPSADFTDTFFKSPAALINKGGSFPSGHAAAIFSVATVVAERYRWHRWVPWVAYGLAATISFSRVPTFAHFPSDVFLGAALATRLRDLMSCATARIEGRSLNSKYFPYKFCQSWFPRLAGQMNYVLFERHHPQKSE
jgi:membrane-associated phospholipid phosphatase